MALSHDLTGKRFGRWTALEIVPDVGDRIYWRCRCDCGNEKIIAAGSLTCNNSKSCGCLKKEIWKTKNVTHGMTYTRIYNIWSQIIGRCNNPNLRDYKYYGGRGITMCQEWRNSFETFRDWALANGYKENLTIDRKDNDGNYTPDNCRWATMKEQSMNKRTRNTKTDYGNNNDPCINNNCRKRFTYGGKTQSLLGWANEFKLKRSTLAQRIYCLKWSFEKAILTPVQAYRKYMQRSCF